MSCLQRSRAPSQNPTKNLHRKFQRDHWSLSRLTMESWHKHPSSLRNERSGRKSRPQSERRNSYRTRAKRTARWTVGRCDGMLLLLAQRARKDGRWQDSVREEIWPEVWRTINSFWNISWVHPNNRDRQVTSTSVWRENAERNLLGLCATCGRSFGQETRW